MISGDIPHIISWLNQLAIYVSVFRNGFFVMAQLMYNIVSIAKSLHVALSNCSSR